MQFKEFALHTDILKALEKLHYEQVLPIQEQVIPEILKEEMSLSVHEQVVERQLPLPFLSCKS